MEAAWVMCVLSGPEGNKHDLEAVHPVESGHGEGAIVLEGPPVRRDVADVYELDDGADGDEQMKLVRVLCSREKASVERERERNVKRGTGSNGRANLCPNPVCDPEGKEDDPEDESDERDCGNRDVLCCGRGGKEEKTEFVGRSRRGRIL